MTETSKRHHSNGEFRNNYPHDAHGWLDLVKWQLQDGWKPIRDVEFPVLEPDLAFIRDNRSEPALTWIGHASFLLQVGGLNIITDPQFSRRASPTQLAGPRRVTRPGIALEDLPDIDIVVISHNHYDHLDEASVEALQARQADRPPQFFVPLRLAAWFRDRGIDNVTELDWWETTEYRGATLGALPVQHFSARTPFDRNQTLWAGWRIEIGDRRVFFAGDTGYSQDFSDIRKHVGPMDLSLIPIGAYEPRWFMKSMHVNPEEAVQIHLDLESRLSVAMHWGTFVLTDEPLDEPPARLASARREAGVDERAFIVLRHGETRKLDW